ncbi:DNA-binding response regulator [Paenibacillus sp. BIHB 4019]|uniref:DNA-binding response regulator n=1 Tax=Paenibacillus sp. BIHB 4019 TaxID=1870819 RepID=A0A1B2DI62_9BACL|nr:response regulator transcription factor [Paenibacillus sp. BIHB 4019]ANY67412.1 DNA-binding response regulator [Paenibacillus sp. BIHB 4019]
MTQPVRILIVDDHHHAREGIRAILQAEPLFEVVGEGCSGLEALVLTEQLMPDLILMDINMKEMDGLEATKEIKARYPYVKIVIITVSDDITHLFEALKKGAQGYLLKNLNPGAWREYLKAIALDEAPLSRELAQRILQEFALAGAGRQQAEESPLTAREQDILRCVAQGAANRDIAGMLMISEHTVKNHLKNILQKLHLDNRVQLAKYAFEQGYLRD